MRSSENALPYWVHAGGWHASPLAPTAHSQAYPLADQWKGRKQGTRLRPWPTPASGRWWQWWCWWWVNTLAEGDRE